MTWCPIRRPPSRDRCDGSAGTLGTSNPEPLEPENLRTREPLRYTFPMEQDLSGFRPSRLWKRLPVERRLTAAELFWEDDQSTDQQLEAVAAIASHMKFRTKSVLGLALEKRAKYLATLPNLSDAIAARALVNYHLA